MKRIKSPALLLKKRVKKVQGSAKFAGILYLLGSIALFGAAAVLRLFDGTCLAPAGAGQLSPIVLSFYQPVLALLEGGADALSAINAAQIIDLATVLVFAVMLLIMFVNVIRCLGKLSWLFKRRASYVNGFNRNAYAMDDMAKAFSSSFAALIVCNLIIFTLSGGMAALEAENDLLRLNLLGLAPVAVGLVIHFLAGLIGGKVTLFTVGEHMQEEVRQDGLFLYFVRNVLQIAATAAIVYFMLCESVVLEALQGVLVAIVDNKESFSAIDIKSLIPAAAEMVASLFVLVMLKHATADTEFNREGHAGAGMHNFTVFAFLSAAVLAAMGVVLAAEMNMNLVIAAAVAFVAFILNCALKHRERTNKHDDVDRETYFQNAAYPQYNNTII